MAQVIMGGRINTNTYASTMLTENKPIGWVAKQLGHSNISMTLTTYARWIEETH
jgi:integrase